MPQFDGTSGNDHILASLSDDLVYGHDGDDDLDGRDGSDRIFGGAGMDILTGGYGADILDGGDGADSLWGGTEFDMVDFTDRGLTQAIVVDLRLQLTLNDGFGNVDQLVSIEGVYGHSRFADTFFGDDGSNFLRAGGNDAAYGFGGDDQFGLDDAPAILEGGDGSDTIIAFSLSRLTDLDFDGLSDREFADHGVIVNLATHQIVDDGFGGSGVVLEIENLGGSALDDFLTGDAGDNFLWGWSGSDLLIAGAGHDIAFGGDGADELSGEDGNDELYGEDGDDLLRGGAGRDGYIGGEGFDRVAFYEVETTQGVMADLRTNTIYNDGHGETEYMDGIEGFGRGTRFKDYFWGNDEANAFAPGRGDRAWGFGGDDVFEVDGAPELIDGGDGNDTIVSFSLSQMVDNGGSPALLIGVVGVTVDLSRGLILDDGMGGYGVIQNVENVGGSALSDFIIGDAGSNFLRGWGAGDRLNGGAGDDFLLGDDGEDILTGGAGADVLNGGADGDTASYRTSRTGVQLNFLTHVHSGDAAGDEFYSIEGFELTNFADSFFGSGEDEGVHGGNGGDVIYGFGGNDQIHGEAGDDTLNGGDGDDILNGGAGNDQMQGGLGNDAFVLGPGVDTVDGGAGFDRVRYDDATAAVVINLGIGQHLGDAQGDSFTSIEHFVLSRFNDSLVGSSGTDSVDGGDGNDVLSGVGGDDFLDAGAGNDTLYGGAGADNLHGGEGNDTLTGGAGADNFRFSANQGQDKITDFTIGQDRILLLQTGADDISDLSFTNVNGGVLVSWGSGSVLLQGHTAAEMSPGDFIFA
jgi:Ca2+-binding RTX toxin-like protein